MTIVVATERDVNVMGGISGFDDGLIDPRIGALPQSNWPLSFADVGRSQPIGRGTSVPPVESGEIAPEVIAAELIRRFPVEVADTLVRIERKAREIVPGSGDSGADSAFVKEQIRDLGHLAYPQLKFRSFKFAAAILRALMRSSR